MTRTGETLGRCDVEIFHDPRYDGRAFANRFDAAPINAFDPASTSVA
jgi:hypothetical protein